MTLKMIRNVLFALLGMFAFSSAFAGSALPPPEQDTANPYGIFEVTGTISNIDNVLTPSTIYGVSGVIGAAWPISGTKWAAGGEIGYAFLGHYKYFFGISGAGIQVEYKFYAYHFAMQLIYQMSDRLSVAGRVGVGVVHHPVEFSIFGLGIPLPSLPFGGTWTNLYTGFSINYRLFGQFYLTLGYDFINSDDTLNTIKAGLAVHFS